MSEQLGQGILGVLAAIFVMLIYILVMLLYISAQIRDLRK